MTSLLDRPHGEYVDLERVITRHLSAENAELLREDVDLAEDILGEAAFKHALGKLYVNEIYASPERQVAIWKRWLYDEPCAQGLNFEALLDSAPAWPEKKGEFLILGLHNTSDSWLDGWLAQKLRDRRIDVDIYRSVIRDTAELAVFQWKILSFGYGDSQGERAKVRDLLTACFLHRRWLSRLGLELPVCLCDYHGAAPQSGVYAWSRVRRTKNGQHVSSKLESMVERGLGEGSIICDRLRRVG